MIKDNWYIVSAGGYDTFEYKSVSGERIVVPGKKQILKYGKLKLNWWIRYLFYLVEIKK